MRTPCRQTGLKTCTFNQYLILSLSVKELDGNLSTMNKRRALAGTFLEYSENYHEIPLKTPSYLSAYYGTSAGDGDMVTCSWAGLAHGPVFAAVTLLNLSLATSRPAQPPARTLRRPPTLETLPLFARRLKCTEANFLARSKNTTAPDGGIKLIKINLI